MDSNECFIDHSDPFEQRHQRTIWKREKDGRGGKKCPSLVECPLRPPLQFDVEERKTADQGKVQRTDRGGQKGDSPTYFSFIHSSSIVEGKSSEKNLSSSQFFGLIVLGPCSVSRAMQMDFHSTSPKLSGRISSGDFLYFSLSKRRKRTKRQQLDENPLN